MLLPEEGRPKMPSGDNDPRAANVAALLIKNYAYLYAYLLSAVGHPHDAEDLFQDVSMAAIQDAKEYKDGTNFRAWVREIARRRILWHARKVSHGAIALSPKALERLELVAAEVEERPLNPREEALRDYLGPLVGVSYRVLQLRYREQLDVPAVTKTIGKTVQAAYAILKRASLALRECIDRKMKNMTA
ncbi:MAG: sigma-70 family RNA polymerase sigma factor [Planctomycetes bacterium]|nr:sigma-70 family RNA polymerase sigma factor [Planctomycetota bacterium]